MDSIFHLDETHRAAFIRLMMQSFGSTYICLWSYSPHPSKCLLFLDGVYYDGKIQQPSSSSGSLATRLFNAYCGTGNYIDNGRVPGFAFKNSLSYLEMQADCLHTMISTQVQLQFYQEAGIKTTVFMGCSMGEIELGFCAEPPVNLQNEMQSWFPSDFSRTIPYATIELPCSPLGSSVSVESIKYLDIPNSSFNPDISTEPMLLQDSVSMSAPISTIPHHQSTLIPNLQFPAMETVDHAIASAILVVLSASPQNPQNLPPVNEGAAFTSYRSFSAPVAPPSSKPSSFKRAVLFFKNLSLETRPELQIQGNQATFNQMNHMIAERRRREKLNESFRILKTMLPQLTKKDKASVLSSTIQYMRSLGSQLGELTKRKVALEMQLSTEKRESGEEALGVACATQRGDIVQIARVSPPTSEARFLDLRLSLKSEACRLTDLVARVLGFLKQKGNVSLISVQSSTGIVEPTPVHSLVLRLKAEGNEFDETGFLEAVRRVVGDLPH